MIEEFLAKWGSDQVSRNSLIGKRWADADLAHGFHRFQRARARVERWAGRMVPRLRPRPRVSATACWDFPIYSQTFVYQELCQLKAAGFPVRFIYSHLNSREQLPPQFSKLWDAKRRMTLHPAVCARDYDHYRERMPDRIESLLHLLCESSGLTEAEVRQHRHFQQAFTFTRTVEAAKPDYLHSYFFYEGTLFTLFASFLLDIPRGVSCYADHMLQDYELKVVPLHLRQCSVVVATSARIKRELTGIDPSADADRIVVKPNAIDSNRFPVESRTEPSDGAPFRVTCVARLEPKKGILDLVDAIHLLRERGIPAEAHVLGGVDRSDASIAYEKAVRSRVAERGLGAAFHLEGRKNEAEIREFLRRSQLFVAPFVETESGDKDGIPTALLEGMATGLPAVTTDAGSIVEVVTDGVNGRIVAQRDPRRLADAIAGLLQDPALRARMGAAAAQSIRSEFDVSRCEKRFHERILVATRRGISSKSI